MDSVRDENGLLIAEGTLDPDDLEHLAAAVDHGWTPPTIWFSALKNQETTDGQ